MIIDMPQVTAPSRTTEAILNLVSPVLGPSPWGPITNGLPAGARLYSPQTLALAGTSCTASIFDDAMARAARKHALDVVVARHGTFPEIFNPVLWDVAAWVNGGIIMLRDLVLFVQETEDYWLLPSRTGACVRLAGDGLNLSTEPPFDTWHQRCTGVCEAAKRIVKATRPGLEG